MLSGPAAFLISGRASCRKLGCVESFSMLISLSWLGDSAEIVSQQAFQKSRQSFKPSLNASSG